MSIELTVIVKDRSGKLFEGADVTVTPGDLTAETNTDGEAVITINGAGTHQVKVEADGVTQTVPFYPSSSQDSARLEVNLQYFEKIQSEADGASAETVQETQQPWYQLSHEESGYALAGAIVLLAVIVAIMRARRKKREQLEAEKKKVVKSAKASTKNTSAKKKKTK